MPNLAIASALKVHCGSGCGSASRGSNCGVEILYVGSKSVLDKKLVEAAGLPFKSIFTGKLRRYFSLRNFIDPFFVIAGFFQSLWIVIRFWPNAVFAKGGFVSLPVAFAAFLMRRPIILHESDRVMGLSNRIVAFLATKVCVAFPDVYIGKIQITSHKLQVNYKSQTRLPDGQVTNHKQIENNKFVLTGNPVRSSIQAGDTEKGYQITGFRPERPIVLVWGGSQGAMEINQLVKESFYKLKSVFQLIHITGHGKQTDISDPSYIQFEYLDEDLKHIYAITDIVVGRSGANSLYELALMQKPNILIPLKTSAHNHQQLNAEYFEQMGASIILRDSSLYDTLMALWHSTEQREMMKGALGRVAKPEAAAQIAELLISNA